MSSNPNLPIFQLSNKLMNQRAASLQKKTQLGTAGCGICRKSNQFLLQRNGACHPCLSWSPAEAGGFSQRDFAHSRIWSLSSFSFERSQSSWGMNTSICQKKNKVRRGSTGWNFQQQKEKNNNNNVTTTVFSDLFSRFWIGKNESSHPLFFGDGLRHVFAGWHIRCNYPIFGVERSFPSAFDDLGGSSRRKQQAETKQLDVLYQSI